MKDQCNWMLDPQVFLQIQEIWGPLEHTGSDTEDCPGSVVDGCWHLK